MELGECMVDLSGAQGGEGVAFVGVGLAVVVGEAGDGDAFGDGGEGSAGVDLGELFRVADENELCVRPLCGVDDGGELTGADHRCLIQHEDCAIVEAPWRPVVFTDEPADSCTGDAGSVLKSLSGGGGESGTINLVAAGFECITERVERLGLSATGGAEDHVDSVAGGGHAFDHASLLGGEVGSFVESVGDGAGVSDRCERVTGGVGAAVDGDSGATGFEFEDLRGRVDADGDFDRMVAAEELVCGVEDLIEGRAVGCGVGDRGDEGDGVRTSIVGQ
jgi:hypothetical protein